MLTVESLAEVMGHAVSMDRYAQLLPAVNKCLIDCGCTTVILAAGWYGQVGTECAGMRYMREIASGAEYEGRVDLGNTQPGDGERFAGRGPIQVTGRHNYTRLSQWAFEKGYVPTSTFFVDQPEQLESDRYGFMGVTWYWTTQRPMNDLINAGPNAEFNGYQGFEAVTAAVNGGTHGLESRRQYNARALSMGDRILPIAAGIPIIQRPNFVEINLLGTRKISQQSQSRGKTVIDCLFIHTVEGDLDDLELVAFMEKMGERSYHYIGSLDGKRVYDLVDTDRAAWSVGDENNRSINYVIGRSYASWTRQQWIDNARDAIRNMAYILVQDNYKYQINASVCPPVPENTLLYLKNPPVISDHKYVTYSLHWGTHTDVGPSQGRGDTGFPWDIFESDVLYFMGKVEDEMAGVNVEALNGFLELLGAPLPDIHIYRDDDQPKANIVDRWRAAESMVMELVVEHEALMGEDGSIDKLRRLANGQGPAAQYPWAIDRAKSVLARALAAKAAFENKPAKILPKSSPGSNTTSVK